MRDPPLKPPSLTRRCEESAKTGSPMLKARAALFLDPPDHAWFDVDLTALSSSGEPASRVRGVTDTAEAPRRGRPRSEKAKQAILTAADELLLEQGLHAMSMDDVAARAGVSKATIYRWWGSKELLALDALATAWAAPVPTAQRDTGSLRGDLLARFRPWLRQLNEQPFGRVIAGLVAEAQTDPEFAKLYLAHFVQPRRDATRALLLRAIERGETQPTPTSRSPSTSCMAPCTTACCTGTHRSPTASFSRSWTR